MSFVSIITSCVWFFLPGLVCHVENIALLLPLHQHFKQTIESKAVPLQEGIVRLDARFSNAWITDESLAGFPSFSGISDLECMVDLFGELTLKEARYVHETDLRLLTCEFSTSDDRYVYLSGVMSKGFLVSKEDPIQVKNVRILYDHLSLIFFSLENKSFTFLANIMSR